MASDGCEEGSIFIWLKVCLHPPTNCIPALAPTFTKCLTDQSIAIGEQLVLFCSVKGNPKPTVEFYRDGVRVTSSKRISVEHDITNTHWRVLIKETTKEDFGIYKAVAKSVAGAAIASASVSPKVIVPVFEQELRRIEIREKEELRMETKITGTEPVVSWFKDGQSLQHDERHEIIQETSRSTYTLLVKEAYTHDSGVYSVHASNAAGSAESSARVDVIPAVEKPRFVKELTSTEVRSNETASFEVTVKGTAPITVTWRKDGQPVNIDNVHITSKEELSSGEFSITIRSATMDDVGKYTCEATNAAGKTESTANLTVIKD
ncbi:unnamed protein product, partial [Nippostrongylus brasiliensis]|uniref:Hemicentin-1 (inferred by orthology to a human protein) n=1 Tax=Nippostrongylus brasiliensis TaxID=27835 RepID=A0A0N4XJ50_NIPBR